MKVARCKRGHERTPENVGKRGQCRACGRLAKREQYRVDPEFRAKVLKQQRDRYSSSAQARVDAVNRSRAWRERVMADADRADRMRESYRLRSAAIRRQAGSPTRDLQLRPQSRPRPHVEEMPAEPIVTWLAAWSAANPDDTLHQLCTRAGFDTKVIRRAVAGDRPLVPLDFIDRVLVGAGESPDTLHALYPIGTLHDDGTGYFEGGWDGEPGVRFPVVPPWPANVSPIQPHRRGATPLPWEPPAYLWPPEHRAVILRIRDEFLATEGWVNGVSAPAA